LRPFYKSHYQPNRTKPQSLKTKTRPINLVSAKTNTINFSKTWPIIIWNCLEMDKSILRQWNLLFSPHMCSEESICLFLSLYMPKFVHAQSLSTRPISLSLHTTVLSLHAMLEFSQLQRLQSKIDKT
jgi:hypothetical protein